MTEFKCTRCGHCCHAFQLSTVKVKEAKRLDSTKLVKATPCSDLEIMKVSRDWLPEWFRDGTCSFYDQHLGCTVYAVRPDLCKNFQCSGKWLIALVTAVSGAIYHDRRVKPERKKILFLKFLKSRHEMKNGGNDE